MRRPVARLVRAAAVVALLVPAIMSAVAAPASAHPLGNFTISHYDALTLRADRIDVLSVVDRAEIPTVQAMPGIDTDGDGAPSPGELAAAAPGFCADAVAATTVRQDGTPLSLDLVESSMTVVTGAASLATLRLSCRSTAVADLTSASTVGFANDHLSDRVGWREITATGDGVTLVDPAVPAVSITDELRAYPQDLLTSPLQIRAVDLSVTPGGPGGGGAGGVLGAGAGSTNPALRIVAAGDARLAALVAAPELTVWVGVLAVVLAGLLGAGHALLPGHGKTVMAAYLAGRRGRRRDALVVGATVTLTHTVGVLVIGLLLSVVSVLAGEDVLQLLGVVSGLLVAVVGVGLLREAWRDRRGVLGQPQADNRQAVLVSQSNHDHDQVHQQDHGYGDGHGHGHGHGDGDGDGDGHDHGHSHGPHGHSHGPGGHSHGPGFGKRGLIGLGVAGGLVPSPSALVVLLGAIALGRTVFGILLVLAYGLGMAATLTAVGLLLVHTRDRLARSMRGRVAPLARRVGAWLPTATATLVIVVGVGLVLSSVNS